MLLIDAVKSLVDDIFARSREVFYKSYKSYEIGQERTFRLNTDPLWGADKPYEQLFAERVDYAKLPKKGDMDDILQTIHDALNYIPMSPKRIYDHKKTFVISKRESTISDIEAYLTNSRMIVLNSCDSELIQVFDFWIAKAKSLVNYDNSTPQKKARLLELSKYLVLGKPGVGKTALLNYVFSVKAPDLLDRRQKVIWVRVDLNDQRNINLNLRERLMSKFLYIFAAYYVDDSRQPFDNKFLGVLKRFLTNKLHKKDKNASKGTSDRAKETLQSFFLMVKDIHEAESEDKSFVVARRCLLYDGLDLSTVCDLAEWTMEFIQKKYGYAFIVIFDGLDSVTLDQIQFKVYRGWLQDIDDQTANEKNRYKAVYIITMRDYTYIDFYLRIMKDRRSADNEYILCRVEQAPFYDILSQRFGFILEQLRSSGIVISKVQLWQLKNNLLDAVNMCLYGLSSKEFGDKYVKDKGIRRESYDLISTLCNNNYRAMLRCFQELLVVFAKTLSPNPSHKLMSGTGYDKFLKHLEGKEWNIYRVLVSGDHGEKAYRNMVLYDSNGSARIQSKSVALIPNVFNYKDTGMDNDTDKFPRNLLKLRAIHYCMQQLNISNLSLVDKLSSFYKCHRNLIRDDTREMIYCGLLSPLVEDTEFIKRDEEGAQYPVRHTKLAEAIFERILRESVYYEIVCDDTPIDSRHIDKIIPLNRYDSSINSLGEYLMHKTSSIIHFLYYLEKVDLAEKKRYENNDELQPCSEPYFQIISPALVEGIKESIRKYLYAYLKSHHNKVELITSWYRHFDIPQPNWLAALKEHYLV